MPKYNVLILGASYCSLLASKMMFGGHHVKLVCLPAEADLINSNGFRVRMPKLRFTTRSDLAPHRDASRSLKRVTANGSAGAGDPPVHELRS